MHFSAQCVRADTGEIDIVTACIAIYFCSGYLTWSKAFFQRVKHRVIKLKRAVNELLTITVERHACYPLNQQSQQHKVGVTVRSLRAFAYLKRYRSG